MHADITVSNLIDVGIMTSKLIYGSYVQVAALFRLATLEDHIFLLNHIIRCPAGIDQWAACFIQLTVPSTQSAEGNATHVIKGWGDPLLDHFGNLLAFFMSPVK